PAPLVRSALALRGGGGNRPTAPVPRATAAERPPAALRRLPMPAGARRVPRWPADMRLERPLAPRGGPGPAAGDTPPRRPRGGAALRGAIAEPTPATPAVGGQSAAAGGGLARGFPAA